MKPRPEAVRARAVEIERPERLAPFFERLAELSSPPAPSAPPAAPVVRVLHWGDSHVAADFWTGELRRLLQERFGDGGAGLLMPGRPWRFYRHTLSKGSAGESGVPFETLGLGHDAPDGYYGLSGVALAPAPGGGSAALEADFDRFEVQLAAASPGACAAVSVDGATLFAAPLDEPEAPEGDGARCAVLEHVSPEGSVFGLTYLRNAVPLTPGRHRLEVDASCGGAVRVLGADLSSGRGGVVWDALGLNGAEVTALGKWNDGFRAALLARVSPALVVVSYGTNEMGRGDLTYSEYEAECERLLADVKRHAPGAALLLTGPIDRRGRTKRQRALLAPNQRLVISALRAAAERSGAAFWDARAAMGGDGSIPKWAAAGLAQRDQVHLTKPGYEHLARLLAASLLEAYNRFSASRASAP